MNTNRPIHSAVVTLISTQQILSMVSNDKQASTNIISTSEAKFNLTRAIMKEIISVNNRMPCIL